MTDQKIDWPATLYALVDSWEHGKIAETAKAAAEEMERLETENRKLKKELVRAAMEVRDMKGPLGERIRTLRRLHREEIARLQEKAGAS